MAQKYFHQLTKKEKEILYKFLNFHYEVIKNSKMPYAREFATIDYLTDNDTIGFDYTTANTYLNTLINNEFLEYDQYGAFPGTMFTEQGIVLLNLLKEQLAPELSPQNSSPVITLKKNEKTPLVQHIWGKIQDPNKIVIDEDLVLSEELIYRFLKFQIGVIQRTGVPYLRELVAEDYLGDIENLSFFNTSKFLNYLIKEGYNEYSQWGAFPGTRITAKGKKYYSDLKKRFGITQERQDDKKKLE